DHVFFFSSRRRHTRSKRDWSSDVCSSDLDQKGILDAFRRGYQGCALPFATVAEQFHLIDSPTVTLYLSTEESQPLIAQLQAGQRSEERRVGKEGRAEG